MRKHYITNPNFLPPPLPPRQNAKIASSLFRNRVRASVLGGRDRRPPLLQVDGRSPPPFPTSDFPVVLLPRNVPVHEQFVDYAQALDVQVPEEAAWGQVGYDVGSIILGARLAASRPVDFAPEV